MHSGCILSTTTVTNSHSPPCFLRLGYRQCVTRKINVSPVVAALQTQANSVRSCIVSILTSQVGFSFEYVSDTLQKNTSIGGVFQIS